MTVTEHERHRVLSWFEDAMGSDLAPIMMKLIPPAGWGDLVTTRDLDHLRIELRSHIDSQIGHVHTEIGHLRGEVGQLRGEMHAEIGKLRREMYTLVLGAVGAATGILGTLIGLT